MPQACERVPTFAEQTKTYTIFVHLVSSHTQRQSIRLLNGLISLFSKGTAIAAEMISFPYATAPTTSSPRFFHGRSHLKPRVVQVAAQSIGQIPLIVRLAQPRLETNCEMCQGHIGDGSTATILAIVLLRKAISGRLIVTVDTLVSRRGAHVVPDAPVEFHRPAGMQNLKVMRQVST